MPLLRGACSSETGISAAGRRTDTARSISGAVAASCDVYFYQLGLRLGLDAILKDGVLLGVPGPERDRPP
jgi:hypothetical protein